MMRSLNAIDDNTLREMTTRFRICSLQSLKLLLLLCRTYMNMNFLKVSVKNAYNRLVFITFTQCNVFIVMKIPIIDQTIISIRIILQQSRLYVISKLNLLMEKSHLCRYLYFPCVSSFFSLKATCSIEPSKYPQLPKNMVVKFPCEHQMQYHIFHFHIINQLNKDDSGLFDPLIQ